MAFLLLGSSIYLSEILLELTFLPPSQENLDAELQLDDHLDRTAHPVDEGLEGLVNPF
jgi:hypothetical protein